MLYLAPRLWQGHASTCFGRNQLFPSSIGLSPLDTGHANDLHISTANDPPRNFRYASICPRLDHLVPGRDPVTPRKKSTPPLVSCGLVAFATASHVWLASPPSPTPWPVLQNVRQDIGSPASYTTLTGVSFGGEFLSCPCRSITTRFQALLTSLFGVLFSFRSLYYYAIGLEMFLALGERVPRFPARFPTHGTQDAGKAGSVTATGLSPSTALRSRRVSLTIPVF